MIFRGACVHYRIHIDALNEFIATRHEISGCQPECHVKNVKIIKTKNDFIFNPIWQSVGAFAHLTSAMLQKKKTIRTNISAHIPKQHKSGSK